MFGFFGSKKKIDEVQKEAKNGFDSVKKDILSIGDWIKHLDSEKKVHRKDIDELKKDLSSLKQDLEEIKEAVSNIDSLSLNSRLNSPFKTPVGRLNKQTPVYHVQTDVQTDVQTPNISNFSITERAILFLLLNSDMKLSHEDLATMLNKEKSTIRGQINAIKSKSEGLIEEVIENNGKKRVYIPDKMKEKILKKQKVRVKKAKKEGETPKSEH